MLIITIMVNVTGGGLSLRLVTLTLAGGGISLILQLNMYSCIVISEIILNFVCVSLKFLMYPKVNH